MLTVIEESSNHVAPTVTDYDSHLNTVSAEQKEVKHRGQKTVLCLCIVFVLWMKLFWLLQVLSVDTHTHTHIADTVCAHVFATQSQSENRALVASLSRWDWIRPDKRMFCVILIDLQQRLWRLLICICWCPSLQHLHYSFFSFQRESLSVYRLLLSSALRCTRKRISTPIFRQTTTVLACLNKPTKMEID